MIPESLTTALSGLRVLSLEQAVAATATQPAAAGQRIAAEPKEATTR